MNSGSNSFRNSDWLLLGLVVVMSCFTYFYNYTQPTSLYWDEVYHVTSAQKYLNNSYFMELHPPVGKLLIAAGEKLIDANDDELNRIYKDTNHVKKRAEGFSMNGYRFFPALLSWITAVVLFFIFLAITRTTILATLFSFLYIFDTALSVHLPGALLEGPMLFFCSLSLLIFLHILNIKKPNIKFKVLSFILGITFALTFLTKITGLFLLLLFPILFIGLWPKWKVWIIGMIFAFFGFLITFIGVWHVHISLGTEVTNQGFYSASALYKTALESDNPIPFSLYPIAIKDHLKYSIKYNDGVPKLDMCKVHESGSPWFYWPLGARSITYSKTSHAEDKVGYLMFQVNPAVWWLSAFAVLIAFSLLTCSYLLGLKLKQRFLLNSFCILYAGYMFGISQIDRVMYLHHYLPPLIISFILAALVLNEVKQIGKWEFDHDHKVFVALCLSICIFATYQFYKPLSTMRPLTKAQLEKRAIFPLWNLQCSGCKRNDPFFSPPTICKENQNPYPNKR
ncbi:MAG: phospholipid carrier-dependent glycosyltransferase [Candidatus Peribacteraceae bacterium]|nr:phospholipid carrier-dependent glycosyltransferase [Candidatus Peribacteraceae bacterium]MDP7454740.1 phospholipid carrier-dependent glycosyltransferase [Candidatus Peribacteraceae bacterium]